MSRHQRAYTLMELLIVIVIIGVLMGVAVVQFGSAPDDARAVAVRQELRNIQTALEMFRAHNGEYPSNDQGLKALVEKPNGARNWPKGGYLASLPKDPWGMEYKYLQPGQHGEVDVYSLGSDKRESENDIGNWMLDDQ